MPLDLQAWVDAAKARTGKDLGVRAEGVRSVDLSIAPVFRDQLRGWGKARKVPGNPPAWATDPATWEEARKAVDPDWASYDEPWAVVASVYQQMGGGVK